MSKQYEKLDDNTLQITKEVITPAIVETYVYDDLVSKLSTLQAQKDAFNADIDQQIADAQADVDAANSFNLVSVQVQDSEIKESIE